MKGFVGKRSLNIWIDIGHTPQYNFYKNFIICLAEEGHTVYLTILDRGKMPTIIQNELMVYPNVKIYVIGKHRLTKFSAIIEANLLRIVKLFFWALNKPIDIAYSNGFHNSLIGCTKGVDTFTFDDDPHTFDYRPKLLFSKQSHYCLYERPEGMKLSLKVKVLPVLKEWAYLAPNIFTPNINILEKYAVRQKEYFFLREVSVGTVNYAKQASGAIMNIASLIPKNKKVLFSLEDKAKKDMYPKDWILLQEPVEDIHSLIYYSCGLVSSGDSMAREAALLGVPSYYLGVRYDMPANIAAANLGILYNSKTMNFNQWIEQIGDEIKFYEKMQDEIRTRINHLFIDINEYMYSFVNNAQNKDK